MYFESERNDANPNPRRTAAPKPSLALDQKYDALKSRHPGKPLTTRGGFAGLQKHFGRYVPSWDYVDVLCSRYWRYKDATFVFYRGAVLSYKHMRIRFREAAAFFDPMIYGHSPAYAERLRKQGFTTVFDRINDVCRQWGNLIRAIQKSDSRSPEDRDSFAAHREDVKLLYALDRLWDAERNTDNTVAPTWKRAIVSKQKHDAKFEPFRDWERQGQMCKLYTEHLPRLFENGTPDSRLLAALGFDAEMAREVTACLQLPYACLDLTKEARRNIVRWKYC
ncbi:hypothetical protein EXIGLDRAFT_178135 [Exidia glandulosa HHB12029]|uniref:Uncharacterized protein n=1 Tax=Exidia glandulosa HHB12029 TaxID=1314781 RepID=A0A165F539_EXIGL|nr:hypothetical protein EXIGLDRAFT_178135 [Exidia glandulosa HHB12029]